MALRTIDQVICAFRAQLFIKSLHRVFVCLGTKDWGNMNEMWCNQRRRWWGRKIIASRLDRSPVIYLTERFLSMQIDRSQVGSTERYWSGFIIHSFSLSRIHFTSNYSRYLPGRPFIHLFLLVRSLFKCNIIDNDDNVQRERERKNEEKNSIKEVDRSEFLPHSNLFLLSIERRRRHRSKCIGFHWSPFFSLSVFATPKGMQRQPRQRQFQILLLPLSSSTIRHRLWSSFNLFTTPRSR